MVVLDASALLAASLAEPGHERVAAVLSQACISAVNLAEVLARLQRDGVDTETYLTELSQTGLEVVSFDHEQALLTTKLLPSTKRHGLSLGDRACLVLAQCRALPALTADRSWAHVQIGVEIELIR